MELILATLAVLAIIFVVPIAVYGLTSKFFGLKEPDKAAAFMLGVLVQKVGTAAGFVAIFYFASDTFSDNWLLYAAIWTGMFAIVEIGQAIAPNYTKNEATAGILSEIIYFPLSAWAVASILG